MNVGKPHDHHKNMDEQLHDDFKHLDEEEQMHMFDSPSTKKDRKRQKIDGDSSYFQFSPNRRT